MRGIVAEVNGKKVVILAQDGTFRKIRASANMTIGSEVDLNQPAANTKVISLVTRVSSIAAAALFAVGVSYGAYCYTLPYSYVDVDINPSVELTANFYDRIIKVEALNEDAKKLLTGYNLKNSSLGDGVSQLLNIAVEQGYLKADSVMGDDNRNTTPGAVQTGNDNKAEVQDDPSTGTVAGNAVLLTVSSTDAVKSAKLKKKIVKKASEELDRSDINSNVLACEASVQQRDDARAMGVTPGKLALIEDAMEDQPELKLEELKKSAVTDLVKKAKTKKAEDNKARQEAAELIKAQETKKTQIEQEKTGDNIQVPENGSLNPSEEKAQKTQELKKVLDEKRAQELKKAQEEKKALEGNGTQTLKKAQQEKEANASALEEEKKQRQKLKDELLDQVQLQEKERSNKKRQEKNSNIKTNQEKAKKDISQNKDRLQKKGKDSAVQDNSDNELSTGKRDNAWVRKYGN
jgi:hypothetical protein